MVSQYKYILVDEDNYALRKFASKIEAQPYLSQGYQLIKLPKQTVAVSHGDVITWGGTILTIVGFLLTLVCWFSITEQFNLDTLMWLVIGIVMMLHKPIGALISTLWREHLERKRHTK